MADTQSLAIGTRGSKLALAQTQLVIDALKQKYPGVDIQSKVIITKGDLNQAPIPLDTIGKNWFTAEIEEALLAGEIDIAVHSMKDLPPEIPNEITTLAVLERADPRDALISKTGAILKDLPLGAVIGTDSLRRKIVLLEARPDLVIKSIRGNVDTRLKKLRDESYDAIILAAAGLARVGMTNVITEFLDPVVFVPAMGQGVLAAQARRDSGDVLAMLQSIQHTPTRIAAEAEQAFAGVIGGGCKTPIGCYARVEGETILIDAFIQNEGDMKIRRQSTSASVNSAQEAAQNLARVLLQ